MKDKHTVHTVFHIQPGSIAEELQIEPGDKIIKINDQIIEDVFDYQYFIQDEYIEITLQKAEGEEWLLEVEKEYGEDLGIEFENGLMSEYRSCHNRCIFCFIDQMPKGMRETLYFKDDDMRLSFLQGNYVTLTNLKDADLDRIIKYRLEPINISFQTTNPELRCRMLNNRFAGTALKKAERLFEAGIEMNGQIVLCKGINDGRELMRSIKDLMKYIPYLKSVSVVPVGITKYREGLAPLEPFSKEDAKEVLTLIHEYQKICYDKYGYHFIHAGDEWYLLAEEPIPEEENYDGYLQLENGVGMIRLLLNESEEAIGKMKGNNKKSEMSLATGLLAYPYLKQITDKIKEKYPRLVIHVYPVINHFFGERITVSGLLTAGDLITQLKGRILGTRLLLPCNMLRSGEDVFLDDKRVADVERALQVKIDIVKSSGRDLVDSIVRGDKDE